MSQNTSEEIARRKEMELDEATAYVLQTLQGRRFLWWLLERCNIYAVNAGGNSSVYVTEGMRNIGVQVLSRVNKVDPTAYPNMMLERVAIDRLADSNGSTHVSSAEE